jgi:hypothetical protein
VEHLPFETEARLIIESVRMVLQPGLVSETVRQKLWDKGGAQRSYRIGFLLADPDQLPPGQTARADLAAHQTLLADLAAQGNRLAALLIRVLSAPGQDFLATCEQALQKLSEQDAVVALLNALSGYCHELRLHAEPSQDMTAIMAEADAALAQQHEAQVLLSALPGYQSEARALYALAGMGEAIVTPIFARSSASGSLMRRKIEPVIQPVLEQIATLRRVPHG